MNNGTVIKILGRDEAMVRLESGVEVKAIINFEDDDEVYFEHEDARRETVENYVCGRSIMPIFVGDNLELHPIDTSTFYVKKLVLDKDDPRKS